MKTSRNPVPRLASASTALLLLGSAFVWNACGKSGEMVVKEVVGNAAPTIVTATLTPAAVPFGGTATLRVQAQDPNAADTLSVAARAQHGLVAFAGAGATASATTTSWTATYTHDGASTTDSLQITVTDDKGGVTTATMEVPIEPPPAEAPKAVIAGPTQGETGQQLSFDGSGSRDPDGTITRYSWDFGDGGTATGPIVTHAYTTAGTYSVGLTVTDNDGQTGRRTHAVEITTAAPPAPSNHAPSVSLSGGQCHPLKSRPCTVSLTASASDPDGDPLTYSWSGCAGGTSSSAQCTVSQPGSSTATVTVNDGQGHSASASATVTGTNNHPNFTNFTGTLLAGSTGSIDFWFDDPDDDNYDMSGCGAAKSSGDCTLNSASCIGVYTGAMRIQASITAGASAKGGECGIVVWVTDDWGPQYSPGPISIPIQ